MQCPVVIFHNNSDIPTMYVSPEIVTTNATAFVIYTSHNGLGLYDAAVPGQPRVCVADNDKPIKCSYGINKKNAGVKMQPT